MRNVSGFGTKAYQLRPAEGRETAFINRLPLIFPFFLNHKGVIDPNSNISRWVEICMVLFVYFSHTLSRVVSILYQYVILKYRSHFQIFLILTTPTCKALP